MIKIGDDRDQGLRRGRGEEGAGGSQGYPATADKNQINWGMTLLVLWIMMIYVTMVYGPIAAFLVELFPTKIRYTSMSLPYHIGNGWFGGMLPLLATAMVAARGDIYYGLVVPDHRGADDRRRRLPVPARHPGLELPCGRKAHLRGGSGLTAGGREMSRNKY